MLLPVVDSFLIVAPFVCGISLFVPYLVVQCFVFFFVLLLFDVEVLELFYFLSFWYLVTVIVLWLSLTVLSVGLQCVIVVFPVHTHLLCNSHMAPTFNNDRPLKKQFMLIEVRAGRFSLKNVDVVHPSNTHGETALDKSYTYFWVPFIYLPSFLLCVYLDPHLN